MPRTSRVISTIDADILKAERVRAEADSQLAYLKELRSRVLLASKKRVVKAARQAISEPSTTTAA